ncbi:MAG: hypothetical protein JWM65_3381 [Sphingomonas bacterium]|nr:hypothetical protein [Sphingomonas bacterium]
MRFNTIFTAGVAFLSLPGCTQSTDANGAHQRDSAAPEMWYQFSFKAEYEGRPVKFDQMVSCGVPGDGGASSSNSTPPMMRRQHPVTIGKEMADGSFLVVRVPSLCMFNRRYAPNMPERSPLPAWRLPGPITILPLVVWNDRRPRTTRIESYVSEAYYKQPRARVRNPQGTVTFMPPSFKPSNRTAVLEQKDVGAYGDLSYLDPKTGKRKGKLLDGFQLWALVPISNLNEYRAAVFGKSVSSYTWPRIGSFKDSRFALYAGNEAGAETPVRGGADFSSPMMMHRCLMNFISGAPNISNLPPDPHEFDYFTLFPSQAREEDLAAKQAEASGQPFTSHAQVRKIQIIQKSTCIHRLNEIRTLTIVGNYLDPDIEVPGSLVYMFETWHNMSRFGQGGGLRLRLDGGALNRDGIIEDKKTGKWYHALVIRDIISE